MPPLPQVHLIGAHFTTWCIPPYPQTRATSTIGAALVGNSPHSAASVRSFATKLHSLSPHRNTSSSAAWVPASQGSPPRITANISRTPTAWEPQLAYLHGARRRPCAACMSERQHTSLGAADDAVGPAAGSGADDGVIELGSRSDSACTADPSAASTDGSSGRDAGGDAGGRGRRRGGGGGGGGPRGSYQGRARGRGGRPAGAEGPSSSRLVSSSASASVNDDGPFYAVAAGWKTGVFRTWDEAKASVEGFSGAVYRKFDSEAAARQFVLPAAAARRAGAGAPGPSGRQQRAVEGAASTADTAGDPDPAGEQPGPYYAVGRGRKIGLMRTWEETRSAVYGVSGAVYKRFKSRQEAEAFLAQHDNPHPTTADLIQASRPSAPPPQAEPAPAPPNPRTSAAADNNPDGEGGSSGAPVTVARASGRTARAPVRTARPPREYYAVAKGWQQTGVYTCWGDAAAAVEGFSGGVYRKYKNLVAAQAFVAEGGAPPRPRRKSRAGPGTAAECSATTSTAAGAGGGGGPDHRVGDVDPTEEEEEAEDEEAEQEGMSLASEEYGGGGSEALHARGLQYMTPGLEGAGDGGNTAAGGAAGGRQRETERRRTASQSVRQKLAVGGTSEDPLRLLDFGSVLAYVDPALHYRLEFDGGSRRNPGDAGFGAVLVEVGSGRHVEYVGGPLKGCSNNVAEWSALAAGMQVAVEMGVRHLVIQGDSELVCRQVSGMYGVNHPSLRPLAARVSHLTTRLESVRVVHVPRSQNAVADVLSNLAMDAEALVAEAVYDSTERTASGEADRHEKGLSAELTSVVQALGEPALRTAREAATAAAAAPRLSSPVLATTAPATSNPASAATDTAAPSPTGKQPGRGRPRKAPPVSAASAAFSRSQISVLECRPPLAARGSVAGSLVEFNRVLIALAFAGRGLLG